MALKYTKKTINHFLHPKNIGKMERPDGFAEIGNMVCGDQLNFYLKVKNGKVQDVKFLSFGCASNIATASIMTEKVKGMTVEEAKKFKWKEVVEDLGGLPQQKIHCSVMAVEGLQKAIKDYEKNVDEQPKKKVIEEVKKVKKILKKK